MSFPKLAALTVKTVNSVPAFVWAAWIVGLVAAAAYLAMNAPPVS
jgi:uncharacterized MnhB-related membrane protein